MIYSIRRTLVLYIVCSAAKRVDCFIDPEGENGHIAENTDMAEPIPFDILVKRRNNTTRQHSDETGRLQIQPLVKARPTRAIDYTTKQSPNVGERIEHNPSVRTRPIEATGYTSPQSDVAQRIDNVPIVNGRTKQKRPPVDPPIFIPIIHLGQAHEKHHISQKNKRQNRENGYTKSSKDVSERNDYNPFVNRAPFDPIVYKFDVRLIFPWMRKTKKRNHVSRKNGRNNQFFKTF